MMPVLVGYQDSVYSWCAKAGLAAKGVVHDYEELNPFTVSGQGQLARRHPFGRVPVLQCADVTVYETLAILTYADGAFEGPDLMPKGALARARAVQVAEMVGAYVYWPCVRQVFSHDVYRRLAGEAGDAGEIEAGLLASLPVLAALEEVAREGEVLNRASLTVADLMLSPMLQYFRTSPQGAAQIARFVALSDWLSWSAEQPVLVTTRPHLFETAGEIK